jgi:hypothetical protein
VNDTRPGYSTDAAQIGAVVKECVDESSRYTAGGGMNDDIRRFVDYEEVVILVEDVQRNGFGLGLGRLWGWYIDLDLFSGA